ncbi:glucose-methanol-choline oxidoreductase domain protein [Mycobacterium xenopi 3993]|nr:glucose-methanol-choline oxidoreductase domain protein [Mycobacterium xenopi 3993]
MGLHPAEELDLAVAELNPREAEHAVWDVIVVGTGMGGGRWAIRWLGQAAKCSFSKRGARPCPVCQGRFALRSRSWPNRERVVPQRRTTTLWPGRALNRRDRRHQLAPSAAVSAVDRQWDRRVVGDLRHGLRAVFCSRLHSPAEFPHPGDSTVPEAWPLSYEQLSPWYAAAEKLLGSVASQIRCGRKRLPSICLRRRRSLRTIRYWSTIW